MPIESCPSFDRVIRLSAVGSIDKITESGRTTFRNRKQAIEPAVVKDSLLTFVNQQRVVNTWIVPLSLV
jgi:hypothetical protein